ncbi:MAG: hypothetical protein LC750_00535 [Actinobacteria bacterium]|nr:hypothetical protein [Actinomycetota bacterium]
MAGTGLPIPKDNPVLTRPTDPVGAGAYSNAQAWINIANATERAAAAEGQIAAAGEKISVAGAKVGHEAIEAYQYQEKQAQVAKIADFEVDYRAKNKVARDEFAKDPEAFRQWANETTAGALQNVPGWMLPHAKQFLSREFEGTHATLLSEKRAEDYRLDAQSITARLKMADDEVMSIASNGLLNTPEGKAALATHKGVLDSAVNLRLMSPDQAQLLTESIDTRAQGTIIRNDVEKVYRAQGYEAARAHLDGALEQFGTKYKVKDEIRTKTLGWLKSEEAGFKGERDAVAREWAAAKPNIATLQPDVLADIQRRAYEAGAFKTGDDIQAHLSSLNIMRTIRQLPQADQVRILATGNLDARLVQSESGGDPTVVNKLGYAGAYQFGAPRLAALGVYTPGSGENLAGWSKTPKDAPGKWTGTFSIPGFPEVKTLNDFLANPDAQKAAYGLHQQRTDKEIDDLGLGQYIGQTIGGVPITRDGIRAMIHLGGAEGARVTLASGGGINPADANGTTRLDYARLGGGAPALPTKGVLEPGNIDLGNRPSVKNPDGTISTVRSIDVAMEPDGKAVLGKPDAQTRVLIPTVSDDGRIMSDREAVDTYNRTGKHLGKFSSAEAVEAYAKELHNQQDRRYSAAPSPGSLTGSRPGLLALGMLKKEMTQDLTKKIADFQSAINKTEFPPMDEIGALGAQVHLLGNEEQKRQVAEIAAQAEYGKKFAGLPQSKREEIVGAWKEKLKTGATQYERHLADTVISNDRKITEEFSRDPYGASYRFSEGFAALPTIDWSSANVGDILTVKVAQQSAIRAAEGLPAFSALRPGEAQQLAGQLVSGDPRAAKAVLEKLGTLPTDIYQATLRDGPVKAALDGMIRSYDPDKINIAMSTLDRAYRQNPEFFERDFGKATLDRLQTWQARKDSLSPIQMAEFFKRADDPAFATARKHLLEEGEEKAKTYKPDDIAYQLGNSWPIIPNWTARNITGSQAPPPVDGLAAKALAAEWTQVFKERYVDTAPDVSKAATQTAERLKTVWGPSAVAGGALMKHPPERFYPQVDGSHDWMKRDVEAAIAASRFGAPETVSLIGPGEVEIPSSYRLISDPRTEADVAARRPPSYVVVIKDAATGRDVIPLDWAGNPMRFQFDPANAQAAAREQFTTRRERALAPTPALGDLQVP